MVPSGFPAGSETRTLETTFSSTFTNSRPPAGSVLMAWWYSREPSGVWREW
jgi:hypothetical protein